MSVANLIIFFSTFTKLPVSIEDIKDQIVESGFTDAIRFIPMDVPEEHLLGMMVRLKFCPGVYAQSEICSLIFYNKNSHNYQQKFTCVKEMIHIVENPILAISDKDKLNGLLSGLIHIANGNPLSPENLDAFLDEAATFQALAVLVPHETREDIAPLYKAGKVSTKELSDWFEIPEEYVDLVMDERWERIRTMILALN